ncbi:TetR/AcrR family transcriptional regulator C-terminal domain-containing protein [Nonomuraea sp. NPDC050691]|uniref:TetR/AcrR family transcriptional regulator C-terminal domain-containing protein n=1 Tax=Nonomuraea sp. NPDC050691 TaxID=3155661 RepID=UPI0033CDF786
MTARGRRLAPYPRRIAELGLLRIDDADLAAAHLTLLTVTDVNQQTFYGAVPLSQEEVSRLVTAHSASVSGAFSAVAALTANSS